jgi:hypothetical protein
LANDSFDATQLPSGAPFSERAFPAFSPDGSSLAYLERINATIPWTVSVFQLTDETTAVAAQDLLAVPISPLWTTTRTIVIVDANT